MTIPLPPETIVHRLEGNSIDNLALKPAEMKLNPPGFSVLIGGTPEDAVLAMKNAYPRSPKWLGPVKVASATVGAIRRTGFDVIPLKSKVANHGRLIHPDEVEGFDEPGLILLATAFQDSFEGE